MKHKTAVKIAIIMVVVFGLITIAYPRIFAPKPSDAPASAAPVEGPPPAPPAVAK